MSCIYVPHAKVFIVGVAHVSVVQYGEGVWSFCLPFLSFFYLFIFLVLDCDTCVQGG